MPGDKKKASTKSVLDKIIYAIRQSPPTSTGSVSRAAIAKFLKAEFGYDKSLKLVLNKAVDKGLLEQAGQSFRVAGDKVVKAAPQAVVTIEIVKEAAADAAVASTGDTVVMKYKGRLQDGGIFDSAPSFDFVLGAGDVIRGWDQGIVGMKVGEERKLHVPSKLGYGKRGSAPDIPPNADLHFEITLKEIK